MDSLSCLSAVSTPPPPQRMFSNVTSGPPSETICRVPSTDFRVRCQTFRAEACIEPPLSFSYITRERESQVSSSSPFLFARLIDSGGVDDILTWPTIVTSQPDPNKKRIGNSLSPFSRRRFFFWSLCFFFFSFFSLPILIEEKRSFSLSYATE